MELLWVSLAAGLYIFCHVKYVGRDLVLATLSCAVAWFFLCQSPLYPQYFAIFYYGRFVILGLLIIICLVAGIRAGKRVSFHLSALLPFLITAYFYLTMFWSVDSELTNARSLTVMLLAAAVVGLVWYGGSSISSLQETIGTVVLPIPLLFWILTFFYGLDTSYYLEGGVLRSPGPMLNPNGIGVIGALLAPVNYYLWQARPSGKTFWLGAFLTCILMVILSGTRGAIGAILLAFTVIALCKMRSFSMAVFLGGLFGTIGFLAMDIYDLPELVQSYLRLENLETGSGRQEAWAAAIELLWERPWTGFGFGTEELLFELFGFQFFEHSGAMVHNSYLGLSVQIGILGAAAFFVPLILVVVKGLQASRKAKEDLMLASLVGTLTSGLVISFTESWLYSVGNSQSLPFWILFGILVRLLTSRSRVPSKDFARINSRPVRTAPLPSSNVNRSI